MIKAYAITGPTASGKTALSIATAKSLGAEIISMDSMQIYKGMDIGTAKATAEERSEIRHHLIDFLSPLEAFSAHSYKQMAKGIAEDISKRGNAVLFVGGTGLYLSALLRPECEMPPESRREYREAIEKTLLSEADKIALWERLKAIDPDSAEAVHYNNVRRVIRALEIYDATGKTKTYFDDLTRQTSGDFDITHVTLDFHSRDTLYERIDRRVDLMVNEGLFDEVTGLYERGLLPQESTAAQAIGYKEIIDAVRSGASPISAVPDIKQASRNYAKRQLTWFRHAPGAIPVFVDNDDGALRPFSDILSEVLAIFNNTN